MKKLSGIHFMLFLSDIFSNVLYVMVISQSYFYLESLSRFDMVLHMSTIYGSSF